MLVNDSVVIEVCVALSNLCLALDVVTANVRGVRVYLSTLTMPPERDGGLGSVAVSADTVVRH